MFWVSPPRDFRAIPTPHFPPIGAGRTLFFGDVPVLRTTDPNCSCAYSPGVETYIDRVTGITLIIYNELLKLVVVFPDAMYTYEQTSDTAHMIFADGSEYSRARLPTGQISHNYDLADGTWKAIITNDHEREEGERIPTTPTYAIGAA